MISKRFTSTPCYGFIPKGAEMFRDPELFEQDMWAYEILNKIKIWYGTVKSNDDNIKGKAILGIQCVYVDLITGNKTTTEQHCGDLSNKDIEVKELELKDNDYFNKCYLDFEFGVTHLKLTTFKGESIELGVEKDIDEKIEYIKKIDNDKKLYISLLREKIIKDVDSINQIDKKEVKEFLKNIFRQEKEKAFRRDFSFYDYQCDKND